MTRNRLITATLLAGTIPAMLSAGAAAAEPHRQTPGGLSLPTLGASSGASAAFEPPEVAAPALPPTVPERRPVRSQEQIAVPKRAPIASQRAVAAPARPPAQAATKSPAKPLTTASLPDRPAHPLANVGMLHIEVLPLQGDADKCGLDASTLQTAAMFPIATSGRLKVGRATLTHMHVRLSAVYVRRLEHCIVNADVRVSSLQPVELQHSKASVPAYVPLWERTDIRLVPRGLAPKLTQDRLRQIAEQLVADWAAQN